jgi:hypothetical protein
VVLATSACHNFITAFKACCSALRAEHFHKDSANFMKLGHCVILGGKNFSEKSNSLLM